MARRSPRVIDTKQRILEAALKLFGEHGYYNVGVDEIAAAAGVTKGALYYYFTDTADLARDLARQLWDRLRADARQAFDREQDTITNLKRGFDAFLGRLQHTPEARFFLRDCRAIPELSIDGTEERAGSVVLMRTMLEHGMARGEIVALDADALTDVLGLRVWKRRCTCWRLAGWTGRCKLSTGLSTASLCGDRGRGCDRGAGTVPRGERRRGTCSRVTWRKRSGTLRLLTRHE